eukprot:640684-Alexandrium_andersonii.AAC.1
MCIRDSLKSVVRRHHRSTIKPRQRGNFDTAQTNGPDQTGRRTRARRYRHLWIGILSLIHISEPTRLALI